MFAPPDGGHSLELSRLDPWYKQQFTIWSNLAFLFPIVVFGILRRPLEATLLMWTMLVSFSYHVCLAVNECLGFTLLQLRTGDHFSAPNAILCLILVLVGPAHHNESFRSIVTVCFIYTMVWAEEAHPLQLYGTMIAIMLALAIFLIRVVLFAHPDEDDLDEGEDPKRASFLFIVLGITFLIGGVIFYFGDSLGNDNYSIFHGWWHILGGIGVGLVAIGCDLTHWHQRLKAIKEWFSQLPEPIIQPHRLQRLD